MNEDLGFRRHALVVLGMHRSGTSAMARVLALCGAQLPNDLMPASASNAPGYWESLAVVKLDEEILDAVDSSWDDIFAGRPKTYLSNFERVFHHRAGQVLGVAFDDSDLIVLKDPRMNVLGAFWDGALKAHGYEPTYVIMVRNPLEVAASLLQRDKLPTDQGILLWLDQMLAAERDTRAAKRLFVTYDQLLGDAQHCLDRVETASGVALPRRTGAASNAIEQFLSTNHRHHALGDLDTRSNLRTMAAHAYAWFQQAASSAQPADGSDLDDLRRQLRDLHDAVGTVVAAQRSHVAEYRRHVAGLEETIGRLDHELAAARDNDEAARSGHRDAQQALDEAQAQLLHYKDLLAAAQANLADARETGLAEAERLKLQSALEDARAQRAGSEERLAAAQADLQAAERAAETLGAERADLLSAAGAAEAERLRLQAALQDAQAQLAESDERLATARADLHAAQGAAESSDAGRRELLSAFEETRAQLFQQEKLLADSRTAERKAQEAEAGRQALLSAFEDAQARLAQSEGRLTDVQADLQGAQRAAEASDAGRQALLAASEESRAQLLQQERQLAGVRAELRAAEADSETLQARNTRLAIEIRRIQAAMEETSVANTNLRSEFERLRLREQERDASSRAHTAAETETLRRLVEVQDALHAAKADADLLQSRYSRVEAEVAHLQAVAERSLALEQELDQVVAERDTLRTERENIFNSTSWKIGALPRRIVTRLRRR